MFWNIIGILFIGLIAGYVARALVPGRDPMGFGGTIVLGVVGSFVGGLLGWIIRHSDVDFSPAGIIGSVFGAVIALLVYRAVNARTGTKA
ncbi:MAG: GlsB/YeaQ/YmgE family stress response membrane protein [Microthrixaceae bacterium]